MRGTYTSNETGPFKSFSLALSDLKDAGEVAGVFCNPNANATTQEHYPRDAIRAGPSATCGVDMECKYASGDICKASRGPCPF